MGGCPMIGRLKGIVDSISTDSVIIDVAGVGYVVFAPARVLSRLPSVGEAVVLAIETVVREDMIRLYGFESEAERDWFRALQSVQGVGAKVAMAILSVLSIEEINAAIALQDHAAVVRANGVGPKLAKRIVAELKDRAPASAMVISIAAAKGAHANPVISAEALARADAVSALVNLGYPEVQASSAVAGALARLDDGAHVEALIREGLKELSN